MIEKIWKYKDYPCVVRVQLDKDGNKLWRCGYVGVPSDNSFYGNAGRAEKMLLPHGNVTYSGNKIPEMDMDTDYYWIGFDCNHTFDACCAKEAEKYTYCHYWTLEDVIKECENLVDDIIAIEEDIAKAKRPNLVLVEDALENMFKLMNNSNQDVYIKVNSFDESGTADYVIIYNDAVYKGSMWLEDNDEDVYMNGDLF